MTKLTGHRSFLIALLGVTLLGSWDLRAEGPAWWASQNVIVSGATKQDFAPATQGQLKRMAAAALAQMELSYPTSATSGIHSMVQAWTTNTTNAQDYAVATNGQLKVVAAPFYTALGLTPPWTTATTDDQDYAIATIGQLKTIFNFVISPPILTSMSLAPATAFVPAGGGHYLIASGFDQNGNPISVGTVTWTVSGSGGTIAGVGPNGAFASNGTIGTYTVTATHGSINATATVTVYTPTLSAINLNPAGPTIQAGSSKQFTATGTDQYGNSFSLGTVNWSVSSGGGTITGAGHSATFESNGTPGTYTITATSASHSGTTPVTVAVPVLTTITAYPADTAHVPAHGTLSMSAYSTDQFGNYYDISAATWTVIGGGGTVTGSGYSADFNSNGTTGTFTARVTLGSAHADVQIVVYTPVLTTFTVYPDTQQIPVGQTQSYSAYATDQFSNPVDLSSLAWTVSGSGGAMSGSGEYSVFTSNGTPGTYTVTATLGSVFRTTTVTVYTPVVAMQIAPDNPTIRVSEQQYFYVNGQDQFGRYVSISSVGWSVSGAGGTINSSGVFTSNGTPGTYTITATSGALSDTTTVIVYSPNLTDMSVSPGEKTLLTGGTVEYYASGTDQTGRSLTPPGLTWSVTTTGGSINSSGLFTSNATAGTFTVTATSGSLSRTATVTVYTSLPAITGLVTKGRNHRAELDWNVYNPPSGTTVNHYNIYRSTTSTGTFVKVGESTTNHYIDRGLVNGTTYWYKVTAVVQDQDGHSLETAMMTSAVSCTPVAPPPIGALDIAFIIDNTGSMGGAIGNVQDELQDIIDDIDTASNHDYRAALVTPDTEIVDVHLLFSNSNGAQLYTALGDLYAEGGGEIPESTDVCLKDVLNATHDFTTPFRSTATKVVILVTDAVPSGGDDVFVEDENLTNPASDEYHAYQYSLLAKAKGVQMGTVAVRDSTSTEDALYRIMHNYYAALTAPAGDTPIYIRVPGNGQGTAAAVLNIIEQGAP